MLSLYFNQHEIYTLTKEQYNKNNATMSPSWLERELVAVAEMTASPSFETSQFKLSGDQGLCERVQQLSTVYRAKTAWRVRHTNNLRRYTVHIQKADNYSCMCTGNMEKECSFFIYSPNYPKYFCLSCNQKHERCTCKK
jgi:hypothetical protein